MMFAVTTRFASLARTHATPGALRRGLIAGSAWGVVMGAVLTAVTAWNCGIVCIPDVAVTIATAVVAGIATIGPLAAFGARTR
jgi:hypothetical protein